MVTIRRLEERDVPAVKTLIRQIMNGEFPEERAALALDDLDSLAHAYGRLGEAFFVAEEGDEIVGTIGVKREDERVALIRRIFVSPDCRKRKIGSRLLSRAVEFCEEVGYQDLVFKTTSRMTGAIELFKKHGFKSRAKVPLGKLELHKLSLVLKSEPSR